MLPVSCLRRRRWWLAALCLLLLALVHPPGQAAAREAKAPDRKAILLVSFGTSVPQAQGVFAKVEAAVKARFRGVEVRWAFTSKKIRHKLAQQGQATLSPAQALANLAEDGYTLVAAQSLHIIPGEEFDGLVETAKRFSGMPKTLKLVSVGQPLLASPEDQRRVAQALLAHAPAGRQAGEALIFMGHGTSHQANAVYPALAAIFKELDPNTFMATVEGNPGLEQVIKDLKARGIKKAWLVPLMSVAGDHARNDMAGAEAGSWASQLTQAGIANQAVLVGMAEYPEVQAVWLDHLQLAWQGLGKD